jgi:hypothetical protein
LIAIEEAPWRLRAQLASNVALRPMRRGYSRLMGADEEDTLERLKALRHELLDPKSPSITAAPAGLTRGPRAPATACSSNLRASADPGEQVKNKYYFGLSQFS